jgi:hypothetical protein
MCVSGGQERKKRGRPWSTTSPRKYRLATLKMEVSLSETIVIRYIPSELLIQILGCEGEHGVFCSSVNMSGDD